jgi:hypothetical protein
MAGQMPGEIRHDHDGAVQDADEQQVLVSVLLVDLGCKLREPRLDLVVGVQDPGEFRVDLRSIHVTTAYRGT